jgi:hypothetical protein
MLPPLEADSAAANTVFAHFQTESAQALLKTLCSPPVHALLPLLLLSTAPAAMPQAQAAALKTPQGGTAA